jgi:hypothetical protein
MSTRTLTGLINYPNGAPWASGVVTVQLLAAFTTATEVYPTKTVSITLESDGTIPDGTVLGVPDTGTAHYRITYPNGHGFECYIAAGAAVDLVTLETIAVSSVDQDDLQTLLDAAAVFSITAVNTTYQALVTDEYLYCTGTTYTVTLPAAVVGTTKWLVVDNGGTGVITVDGSGGETVNGAANIALSPNERRVFIPVADGAWRA